MNMQKNLKLRNIIIAALICFCITIIIYFHIPSYEIHLLADDLQLRVNETKYVELQFEVINLKPVFHSKKKLQAYKQLVEEDFPKYYVLDDLKDYDKNKKYYRLRQTGS